MKGDRIEPPAISDGVIYRVLRDLLVVKGERINYRSLDVEQIGSVYEARPLKSKAFPLFREDSCFTDDTVLTVAVADVLLNGGNYGPTLKAYYRRYPHRGFGYSFARWAASPEAVPYGSYGNGAAMRVGPVAWAHADLDEVLADGVGADHAAWAADLSAAARLGLDATVAGRSLREVAARRLGTAVRVLEAGLPCGGGGGGVRHLERLASRLGVDAKT